MHPCAILREAVSIMQPSETKSHFAIIFDASLIMKMLDVHLEVKDAKKLPIL
jgi:hypothetical protein